MNKKIFNLILILLVIVGTAVCTISYQNVRENKRVEQKAVNDSIQTEKKAINDSIILLNRLWMSEYQRFQSVMDNLDSISKNGGVLTFTNKQNKVFELTLKPKQ